jgi:RNA 3'-terminal phosphate cyclase (ATP)/RNA 3'-terminal phosphate cyclase (GTP)
MTGTPIRVRNIRANRPNPGLAAQHVTAVAALAALCDAEVRGLAVGSTDLVFRPGSLHGGRFRFDIGTAGSVTLVLQAVLPAAAACGQAVDLRLIGGTDVKWAPPLDYVRHVFLPLVARMGLEARIAVGRRGYYPRGGGEIEVAIRPRGTLTPLALETPGPVEGIQGVAHVANLPDHIAKRMKGAARKILSNMPKVRIEEVVLSGEEARGRGGAIVLWARTAHTVLGASALAERGVPAERVGTAAASTLAGELASGATLDVHAADQLLVHMAVADGPSRFLVRTVSGHAETTMWLLERFVSVDFAATPTDGLIRVEVRPS